MCQQSSYCKRILALLVIGCSFLASPTLAGYWPTEYFLQQTKENQAVYLTGLIDMYAHARDEIAPDPNDWVEGCLRNYSPEDLRQQFVDWLFNDPASWRFSPAKLFLEALEDFCRN